MWTRFRDFYDRGEKYDPDGLGTKLFYEELENDRYIEIWNLVFSQYNSQEGVAREDYKELPQKISILGWD